MKSPILFNFRKLKPQPKESIMLLEVKFRVKGTRTMETNIPLRWVFESKTTDKDAVAHALSADDRWQEAHQPDDFVIEEVSML